MSRRAPGRSLMAVRRPAAAALGLGLLTLGTAACSPAVTEDADILDGIEVVGVRAGDVIGPLDEIIGWHASVFETPQAYLERAREVEDRITACMNEQGFEYIPNLPALGDFRERDPGPAPGTREFVEEWGYGSWSAGEASGDQSTFDIWGNFMPGGRPTTAAGAAAWEEALNGKIVREGQIGEYAFFTETDGLGCSSLAYQGLSSPDERLKALADEATAFRAALPENSAFDELNREWAQCMRERGFVHTSPQEAERSTWPDPSGTWTFDTVADAVRIAAGRAAEIELATVDLDCQEQTDYVVRFNRINVQLQIEYIATHRGEIEELLAAVANPTSQESGSAGEPAETGTGR